MPFNRAVASGSRRIFILAPITSEDLSSTYDVEAQVAAQFPTRAPTRTGDIIQLSISGVNIVAANTSGYAIDANGLHDLAIFKLSLTTGCLISGRGGDGGNGGPGAWDNGMDDSDAGDDGEVGGTAIRLGCTTEFLGTGTIRNGYGGGGGGGGGATGPSSIWGGGGGGGGAPLGVGGLSTDNNGATATVPDGGAGGTGPGTAGDGGDGGDSVGAAQAGQDGGPPIATGGAAGSDGDAMHTQGFSYTAAGGITITGTVT